LKPDWRKPVDSGLLLMAIVAIAFAARLGVSFYLGETLNFQDSREYHALASHLAESRTYQTEGKPTAYWPPGYPFFLAVVYSLFGPSVTAARIVQSAIGSLSCFLVYLIAVRISGRRPALLAAAVCALYPLLVYSSAALLPSPIKTCLIACVVLFSLGVRQSGSGSRAVLAGVFAAGAVLVAPSILPTVLIIALWIAWHDASRRGLGRLVPMLFILLPIALCVGAWSLRNYRALGKPVAVSTNGGFNFWLGNHPDVTAETGNRMTPRMQRELGTVYARHKNEAERDSVLYEMGRRYISEDPKRFLRLWAAKSVNLWRLSPRPMTEVEPAGGKERLLSLLSYGLLLPFAAAWLIGSVRSKAEARLILLMFIAFTATHAVFITKVRFRIPIDPYVIIYAAGGLIALFDFVRNEAGRRSPH
jgi:4-amino-4-deoxy-L-arabinose transferase-like glycosyltransferase